MLNNNFPVPTHIDDAYGIRRRVHNLGDILKYAKEKADVQGDGESHRYVKEVESDLARLAVNEVETVAEGTTPARVRKPPTAKPLLSEAAKALAGGKAKGKKK